MNDLSAIKSAWCKLPGNTTSLFRREFILERDAKARFAVSADHRYRLYLDGEIIGDGPCRGDLEHYRYECYGLTLKAGPHVLAAEVIRFPFEDVMPWGEIHSDGGFWCGGEVGGIALSTEDGWICTAADCRTFRQWDDAWKRGRIPAPPMEAFDFSLYSDGWKTTGFDVAAWTPAQFKSYASFKDQCLSDPPSRLKLVPSTLPRMERRRVATIAILTGKHLTEKNGIVSGTVPTGRHRILLDLGIYRTYQLTLIIRGGQGHGYVRYAEHLWDQAGNAGTRHAFTDGVIGSHGLADRLQFGGNTGRFQPFTYRSGRFIELEFELRTALEIQSLSIEDYAFPLELKAAFSMPGQPVLEKIFEVSWHTARCCAHEHYEDCPYWEQMQYVGDTRIQALISYAAAGEFRLGRQAIEQFDSSRIASGLTMSRYPSNFRQIIPQFSLYWIMMIDDYYRYTGDASVITEHWQGMRDVLDAFRSCSDPVTGLIGPLNGWNFADWTSEWEMGCTNRGMHCGDTLTNLIFAAACRIAAKLWRIVGCAVSDIYEEKAQHILETVERLCYSPEQGLYRDVPGMEWYSQHTNAWAILSGVTSPARAESIGEKIVADKTITQSTLYYRFYLLEAMRKISNENGFEQLLESWRERLKEGFTTFPECPDLNTRSDCHAWSAGPVYEFITHYAGITPGLPGFKEIAVRPHGDHYTITAPVGDGRLLTVSRNGKYLHLKSASRLHVRLDCPEEIEVNCSNTIRLVQNEKQIITDKLIPA